MGISARREREKQYRRDTILTAARDLFFAKGYRTTMEEIAERSELSKGTLYLYFNSKDELYISVIMEGFRLLEERMNRALAGAKGTEERVKAIYFSFIDHCLENREYFRITQYFLTEDARENTSHDLVETINGYTGELLEPGVRVIQEGIEGGEFREDTNASDIALITWRMATGILDLAVMEDEADGGAENYRELFETAIETLLRGVRKRKE
ncbi:MAG: TetR/AcrR family transcriptional regulator [Actinobacteria bacterium]|nr:TetR/AcrR family transcriptional regulator [Actinomycetota bacterium]